MSVGKEFTALSGGPVLHIQHKGVFDMDGLYKAIAGWFLKNKYKFYEKNQRVRKVGPFGVERLCKLEGEREMDEYHKWTVWVHMETWDEHEVDVVNKQGVKKKMTKGKLWIEIKGGMHTDYEGKWEGSMFALHLRSFYNKYIVKKRLEALWWDPMYYAGVQDLHAYIREKLKMESQYYSHKYAAGVH